MTTKKEEARLAYGIWKTISLLESILWEKYDRQFLELIRAEEGTTIVGDNLSDSDDPYPF